MSISFPSVGGPAGAAGGIASATRYVLSNGIIALIQRNPTSPTVSIRGEIGIGAVHEPPEKTGLTVFTGAALIHGTERRTFQQIVAETEERACNVGAGGWQHTTSFAGKTLTEDLPLVLEILSDMVIRPTFPAQEVERLRGRFLMNLRENEQETRLQARRAILSMLYPPDHPYSRIISGTIDTVSQITRDDLIAFHQNYHPAVTMIAIVGDVEPDSVIALLEQAFAGWEPAHTPPEFTPPPTPVLTGIQRRDVPMPGKTQSDIVWSVHGPRRTDPDYYAAMLANRVLGRQGIGGRLGDTIRKEQGMAYYISSSLEADRGRGPWSAMAGVNPADVERAIAAMLREIEQFRNEGPNEQELADVRAYLTGSMVLGLETNAGIAGALLMIERYKLGLDYISTYPTIINSISREQIVEVTRKYLSTEHYTLAVSGPTTAAGKDVDAGAQT